MNMKNPHARLTLCASAVLSLMATAHAQTTDAPATLERIQITGSSIKRLAGETALPVSVIKSEELEARGHTELKDLVLEMPQSLSLGTNSGAAGPMLNLRGLGPMRTLTLLNGRRMANEPLQDQYVSVNVIPRMALDRAETLRDGASSIYGSDAIGGVQNFYTFNSFKGARVKAEWNQPEHSGGGETKAIGAIVGVGDLNADGWNAYLSLDHQRKSALFKIDRPELYDYSVLSAMGLGLLPDNKNPSPIANFGFATGANSNYNPAFATGCAAPYSLPTLGAGSVATPATYSNAGCYRNPNYYDAVTDGSEITNVFGKLSWKINNDHSLALEGLHSKFNVQKYRGMQVPAGTAPATTYSMPATSRFYPGKGITPAVKVVGSNTGANSPAMFIDASKTPGTVTDLNMNNRTIYFVWGPAELGSAYRNDEQTNDRLVLSAEGTVAGFDYRVGLNYGRSLRDTRAGAGYILYSKAQEGFTKGILNPFGLQDEAGLEYLRSIEASDYSYRVNRAYNRSVDVTLTRSLMDLAGGPLMLAVTGEVRRDSAKVEAAPLDYVAKNANGSYAIDAFGNVSKHDLVGETPTGVARDLGRNIKSAVIEVDAPVTRRLSFNAAVRSDTYSDLKTTTVNPKLSARYQALDELVLRASANTGFRAPSIMDIQNPTPEVRTQMMDDPVLCPSATPTITNTGNPVNGFTRDQVCNQTMSYWTKSPDNSFLKPEKSKGWTLGLALEPTKGLLMTADYWGIRLTDMLGAVAIAEVQQQPAKYATNIIRKADGTIDYIIASQANRGDTSIRGLDLSMMYRVATPIGQASFMLDGTYYESYRFSAEKNGEVLSNVGIITNDARYGGAGVNSGLAGMPQINPRWKHTASVGLRNGPWSGLVSVRYNTALTDITPRAGSTVNRVSPYSQYGASLAYSGFKGLKLSLAVNNITNATPPITANSLYVGYITSMADVLGRAYKVTADYSF
ncbi:TonB-dependent receptor domain-containing protein [Roseateles sp. P5_E1]